MKERFVVSLFYHIFTSFASEFCNLKRQIEKKVGLPRMCYNDSTARFAFLNISILQWISYTLQI